MRQNNEEYELGTVEVIVNKVEKTLTKVIFSDYLGTIEYTLTYGEGGQIEKIGYTVEAEGETQEMIYNVKREGEQILIADEEEYPIEKGSLFMTGPDVVHAQITDSQDLLEEYCLGFEVKKPKKSCDSEASKALLDTKFWIGKDSGNGETLFEMLSAESQTRSIGYQNNIKNIISSILVVLIRAYTGNSVSTEITSALSDDRRINIIDYMFLYKYSTVTRDELAKKLNLSQRQLHRILLKQYGKTFSELKSEARLNKARELLQNGKTYEEAATAVGYSDMRSFLKLIKKK